MVIVNVLDVTSKEDALLRTILHEPLYGAEMAKKIYLASNGTISYKAEALYPVLARLERDGLATVRWGTEMEGVRKKYYTITDKGRELIQEKQTFSQKCQTLSKDLENVGDNIF